MIEPQTKWWVRGALYGLTTSLRAWGRHRDKTLKADQMDRQRSREVVVAMLSDPNVWLILAESLCPVGILLCYVDDLLVLGPRCERDHLLEHVSTIWSCSPPVPSESGDRVA